MPVGSTFQTKAPERPKPIDADVYTLEVVDVNSEMAVNPFEGGEEKERLTWVFVVLDKGNAHGRTLTVRTWNKWFVNGKTGIKSGYFALVEAILSGYGTQVDQTFGETFNPNDIIGKQVRASVVINKTDRGEFNKISGYMPVKKELEGVDPKTFQEKAG